MGELEIQTEPPLELKWYQKIVVDSQKKLVGKASKDRIMAIDWCKGVAIIALCYYHLAAVSIIDPDMWITRSIIFVWFNGPTTFLFYAGLNIALSYRTAREKNVPFKNLYLDTIRRMLGLYVVSAAWNLANAGVVFRWDILQCIALSTILTFPLLKFSTVTRFCIACIIYAASLPLYTYLISIESGSILVHGLLIAFFDPYLNSPLLPTIATAIIGTVVIDVIYPIIKQLRQANRENNVDPKTAMTSLKSGKPYLHLKTLFIVALVTFVLCIIFGSGQNLDAVFQAEQTKSVLELHTNPLYAGWQYIPNFLVRLSPINYIYDLSIVLSLFLLAFYYFSIKKRGVNTPSKITQTINFMGQFSLSYFLYGFIFTAFGKWANAVTVWFGLILMMTVLTLVFKFILRKAYGTGLLEWVMVFFAVKWTKLPDIRDIQVVYPEKVGPLVNQNDAKKR